jgi:KipI family sensor histidine kinase inhibitor
MSLPTFKSVADHALLIEFGTHVDDDLNKKVVALDQVISRAAISGVVETVPALVNLLVIFDPMVTTHTMIQAAVSRLFPLDVTNHGGQANHRVSVCYDTELSPDLICVARANDMSVNALIAAHLSAELRVSMYGFAPGFAYLSGLPQAIQVPRKPSATRGVPTGRVMIAGPQCLITTVVMPTGWSIIGRSPLQIIQDNPDDPFLFKVGDTVVFDRIERADLPIELQSP